MGAEFLNLDEFERDLETEAREAIDEEVVRAQKTVVAELLKRIVLKSPVDAGTTRQRKDGSLSKTRPSPDSGRHRASWQVTIGVAARSRKFRAADPIAEGIGQLTGLGPFQVVYITSNAPAIEVLEYGEYPNPPKQHGLTPTGQTKTIAGFSRQAPQGMVQVSVEEVQAIFP